MSRPGSSDRQQMDLANAIAEPWDWQEDIRLGSNSSLDISHCLWDRLNQIQKDSWCMLDETTPVKDYTGFDYPVSSVHDEESIYSKLRHRTDGLKSNTTVVTKKGMEEYKNTSSQLKRRRMLQFPSSEMASCIPNENVPSALVKSKMTDSLIEESGDLYLPNAVHEEKRCSSGSECMDQLPEEWMMECFNEHEMQMSSDDINISGDPEDLFNVSVLHHPPEMEMDVQQKITPRTPRIYFTGTPSLSRTLAKSTAPVVYPFTLIKPCGVQGHVTLNDINERILTPVASKSKHKKNKDDTPSYPTSGFSGKPVVALTKIHTEGGRGSITIMRTKG